MKTEELERKVVALINPRVNAIVPNVSWGLKLNHECDLLYLDKQNRFTEIELKVSLSDLKADFKKKHNHYSNFISRLVYAVPIELKEHALNLVPKHCGIIIARDDFYCASWLRIPKHDINKKPTQEQIIKFLKLGCIRIWKNKQ